jgi:DNA-binding NarL/FixJ family response regulator
MKDHGGRLHRVLVIDDQLLVRAGVAALLDRLGGYTCVGTAAEAEDGLAACLRLRPDLLLLDLHLPPASPAAPPAEPMPTSATVLRPASAPQTPPADELQGLELLRVLRSELPAMPVVVLSARTQPAVVRAALRAGAAGFVAKDFALEHLAQALEVALAGHRWLSPGLDPNAPASAGTPAAATPALTRRQCDVLSLLARGRSNKEIARLLRISLKTVEYHRGELIARLDLHDVASLTRFAVAQGLVD